MEHVTTASACTSGCGARKGKDQTGLPARSGFQRLHQLLCLQAGPWKGLRALRSERRSQPIFEKIENPDAILIELPFYLSFTTGVTRCLLERLIYPYLLYVAELSPRFKKKIKTAFIYTAGTTDELVAGRTDARYRGDKL